jgi:iron complex outermembrane recepter protein
MKRITRYLTSAAITSLLGGLGALSPAAAQEVPASGMASAALAQETPDSAAATPAAAQEAAQDEPASEDNDIIVTAQRREQRLQDVPISVTALTAEDLTGQGITSTHDLSQSVTGMTITESGGYVQPFIRGVGSTVTNIGEPGSAAFYIDGVYMPTVNGQLYELANVESIQVLKGPQGTLFGRNANTGAIIITTRQPQFEPHMSFNVGIGNFNAVKANGFVTGPLSDSVAVSLAGNFDRHDGWFINRNPTNNAGRRVGESQRWTVRGTVLINVTDDLDITLSADAMDIDDASPIIIQPINRYQGYVPGALLPTGPYDYIGNENVNYLVEQQGVSGRINWDLGSVALTSTTAFRHYENHSVDYDSDTTPIRYSQINNNDVGDNFTQELLLNSDGSDKFSWVLGGFYLRQDGELDPLLVRSAAGLTTIAVQQVTEAYAGFADATVKFGPLELTGGLRYSHETKTISGSLNGVQRLNNVEASWNSLTPRGVIAYHASPDFMVYGSFSQGFKSGAFNANALSPTPIDPEKVDAFEIGAKFNPFRGLTLNGAGFYYITKDLQVQALNPGTNLIELRNAAKVISKGFDFDLAYSPVERLNLRVGVSYLDATFDSFPNAQVFLPVPGGDGRNASAIVDVTGRRNVRSPEWTFNFAGDYSFELADGSSIQPSFNVYHSSEFFWTVDNRLREPAHTVVNASLSWNLPGDRVSLTLWGRNIFDELRFRNVSAAAQADRRAADEPALYGVRLSFRY